MTPLTTAPTLTLVPPRARGTAPALARTAGNAPPLGLDLSIIIVSFNTRDTLRTCLTTLLRQCASLRAEIIVVDNGSHDRSARMVAAEFPTVRLLDHGRNIGFGAANNLAFQQARGRYLILLNSDAFVTPGALHRAIAHMDARPRAGIAGARLIGEDGSPQPSAHAFPNLLLDFFMLSGLADRFPRSRLFGRMDRTWDLTHKAVPVDWVTGAFLILRPEALARVGHFDEEFFLYFEEVDLCRRFKQAGYEVWYLPDVQIIHLGGASAQSHGQLEVSRTGSQVMLWHMRSALLYYRKYHRFQARAIMLFEAFWYWLRALHNRYSREHYAAERARSCSVCLHLMLQAWGETDGGRNSPPRPW